MFGKYFRCFLVLALAFSLFEAAAPSRAADTPNNGDYPTQITCNGDSVKFAYPDTCWPGDTITVTVLLKNDDQMDGLYFEICWSQYLSYVGVDFADSPWEGTYTSGVDEDSSHCRDITLVEQSDTLGTSDEFRRLFDIRLRVSPTAPFNVSHLVYFSGDQSVHLVPAATCDLVVISNASPTTPDASVRIYLDCPGLGFSNQGMDGTDVCKDDSLAVVRLRIYSNFPLGYFQVSVNIPDKATYSSFQPILSYAYIDEIYGQPGGYMISGQPATRPSNNQTLHIANLKLKISNFEAQYNGNWGFDTIITVTVIDAEYPCETMARNYGGSTVVPYDDIDQTIYPISLPDYWLQAKINNANVDPSGHAAVPVYLYPRFPSQYYNLYIKYDYSKIDYDSVQNAGGSIPSISDEGDPCGVTDGDSVYQFESDLFPDCHFVWYGAYRKLFTMHFDALSDFRQGQSTSIEFTDYCGYQEVYDWFSPDGANNKIIRDSSVPSIFQRFSGTLTFPVYYNQQFGNIWHDDEIYKIPVMIAQLGVVAKDKARIGFDFAFRIDSVTAGSYGLDSKIIESDYVLLDLGEDVGKETGTLANLWTTVGGPGKQFILLRDESWILYNVGGGSIDTVWSAYGDTALLGGRGKVQADVPVPLVTALGNNYPNPFNGTTQISFSLAKASNVQLNVIDILGREVRTIASGWREAGEYTVTWDGRNSRSEDVATGLYFYSLRTDNYYEVKKMTYLK
jgi:hypothetical protein